MHTIQTALPRRELANLFAFLLNATSRARAEPGIQAKPISRPLNISSRSTSTTLSRLHYTNGHSKLVPRIHVVGSQSAASQLRPLPRSSQSIRNLPQTSCFMAAISNTSSRFCK